MQNIVEAKQYKYIMKNGTECIVDAWYHNSVVTKAMDGIGTPIILNSFDVNDIKFIIKIS